MCNLSLPDNAINVTDVVPGMHIRAAYSGEQGIVSRAVKVGTHTLITFEGSLRPFRATNAGTFRLVDVPEGYGYHYGHGCQHDW